ncbi:MAG: endonuclease/exonuclease/phosphatase family protein [Kiritimatiellae bacterium]|nr:endonuclease/exonuclease/phosphatase family protein [Kiritimatiellia bacterium]MCO6401295.1 endonuclease/exonuclease/phosphatase family protein [Verrucomicrobiota bacterium]
MKLLSATLRTSRRIVFPVVGLLWILGWYLGEAQRPWLWLYYIPAPFIAAWGTIDLILRMHRAGRLRSIATLAITLLALTKVFVLDSRWNRPKPAPATAIRAGHWNVAHTIFGYDAILQELAQDNLDLVVLVEARYAKDLPERVERALGLPCVFQDQGMAVLSRYPFEPQGTISIPHSRSWWARVDTPSGPLDLVMLDVLSHPALARGPILGAMVNWIRERPEKHPLLLVGDFNTLRDSHALDSLRKEMRHAYEIGGRGWPYSWPLPIPVYSIDHAWVSSNITVYSYQLRSSALSDHLRQELTLSFSSATNDTPTSETD